MPALFRRAEIVALVSLESGLRLGPYGIVEPIAADGGRRTPRRIAIDPPPGAVAESFVLSPDGASSL